MPIKIFSAVVIEVAYAMLTRTWLRKYASGVELELLISACRVVTLALYWILFKDIVRSPRLQVSAPLTPLYFAAILPLLLVPFFFNGGMPSDKNTRVVFALTSVIVAAREEFLYRGVLQTLLKRYLGSTNALILSSAIFTLYHYGAQPFTVYGVIEIFSMGCVLGLVYLQTGSLLVPVIMHSVYDASWSLGPVVSSPPNDWWRIPLHLSGLALIAAWAVRYSTNPFQRMPAGSAE